MLLYRLEIYVLIQKTYPALNPLTFLAYLSAGLTQDARVFMLFFLFILLVSWSLNRFVKIKLCLLTVFFCYQFAVVFLAVDFFKIYETSLQSQFISSESLSGVKNGLRSLKSDLSGDLYIKLAFSAVILVFLAFITAYLQNKNKKRSLKYKLFPLIILLLMGLANFYSQRVSSTILQELAVNPTYNFLFVWIGNPSNQDINPNLRVEESSEVLDRPFNTQSLFYPTQHFPIQNIPKGKKYNLIFYFFESTAAAYKNIKYQNQFVMENWRRLEKNSVVFTNHYANYPLSINALLNILAGIYDSNGKDPVLSQYPGIPVKTLPEILAGHGYQNYYLHTGHLDYAGQDVFLKNRAFEQILDFDYYFRLPGWQYEVGWGVDERVLIPSARKILKQRSAKPFFMVISPSNPHIPYSIPDRSFQITEDLSPKMTHKEKSWKKYINSLYYADQALGQLINALEREGLMENTLLFLFADHGEAFYQHPQNYGHTLFIYEENVKVPFLIYHPRLFKKTETYSGITRHIDLLPSVLDLIGVKTPQKFEGVSFFQKQKQQFALLHTSWKDDYNGICDGNWKYIQKTKSHEEELYDLSRDPAEKNNLALIKPDITEKMRRKVNEARKYKASFYRQLINPLNH